MISRRPCRTLAGQFPQITQKAQADLTEPSLEVGARSHSASQYRYSIIQGEDSQRVLMRQGWSDAAKVFASPRRGRRVHHRMYGSSVEPSTGRRRAATGKIRHRAGAHCPTHSERGPAPGRSAGHVFTLPGFVRLTETSQRNIAREVHSGQCHTSEPIN